MRRNLFIGLMHQSVYHGIGCKAYPYSRDQRGISRDRSTQRPGTELEGICPAKAQNRRSEKEVNITRSPLTKASGAKGFDCTMIEDSELFSICYETGRRIISDPDDEDASLLSHDLFCRGNCERCPV
jgi:hypothetical protein